MVSVRGMYVQLFDGSVHVAYSSDARKLACAGNISRASYLANGYMPAYNELPTDMEYYGSCFEKQPRTENGAPRNS